MDCDSTPGRFRPVSGRLQSRRRSRLLSSHPIARPRSIRISSTVFRVKSCQQTSDCKQFAIRTSAAASLSRLIDILYSTPPLCPLSKCAVWPRALQFAAAQQALSAHSSHHTPQPHVDSHPPHPRSLTMPPPLRVTLKLSAVMARLAQCTIVS